MSPTLPSRGRFGPRASRSPAASSGIRASRYDERPMSPTTSPFGPLAVLLDPRAGHGAVGKEVGAVEHALEARGLEYRLRVGDSSEELKRLSAAALDEGYRFLAAVGDDATIQAVVNGMFREGRPIVEAPVLGVVAAGSGSDLPLSFGLPGDTERAIEHLSGADTYPF